MIRHPWFRSPWLVLITAFLVQWLLLFSIKEPTWDAVFYYVYARSVVFDADLQFANDYRLSYPTAGEHFESKQFDQVETQTGRANNLFAIGSSLLWLPWLTVLRLAEIPVVPGCNPSGFERFFTSNIAMLSALFGFLAIGVAYHLTQRISTRKIALISAVTLFFTTPLIHYQFREPLYSHTASALAVALCVYVWWKQHDKIGNLYQGLGLGALIGLAGLVRWENLAYILLPLVSTLLLSFKLPSDERRQGYLKALIYLLAVAAALLAVFSLQMSVWKVLFGSFLTIPQGNSFLDWRAPFLIPFLFSSFRGLLPWMPVFFMALAGLVILAKQKPQLGIPLLFMLLFVVYSNGSTRDWFAGGGFGPRRFSGTLVMLVIGYGIFLQFLPDRFRMWWAGLVGLALILHQWILLRFGLVERLGGFVTSMEPDFFWKEVPLQQFVSDLLAFVPQVWKRPLDFLVFSDSLLDYLLRRQIWPVQHISALLFTALFLLLIFGLFLLLGRQKKCVNNPVYVAILGGAILILADLWILLAS